MTDPDPQILRLAEAILFASAEPVAERRLAARLPDDVPVAEVLAALVDRYRDRGVNLVRVGEAWAFRTAPDLAALLTAEQTVVRKLSRAAIETLAIIAYQQPITRAEIEAVRGVHLGRGTLDALFEEGWIAPRGRRQSPGRPTLWGTTAAFLDHFGLSGLEDLPGIDELKAAGLLDLRPAVVAYGEQGGAETAAGVGPEDPGPGGPESGEDETGGCESGWKTPSPD